MDISKRNIQGKCDLKCVYNFEYKAGNIIARNDGIMISLLYDNNPSIVQFNNEKYEVKKIYIVSPSIHTFSGIQLPAEFIIEHQPIQGGNTLSVAIPMTSTNDTTNQELQSIIEKVASLAPQQGESVNLNIDNFSLQSIVPKKPFYTYTDSSTNTDWVVFDKYDALSFDTTILTQIIQPFLLPTTETNSPLFYNSLGPNQVKLEDDSIYISCSPTGSSDTETEVTYNKTTTNNFSSSIRAFFANPLILQILIGIIGFTILLFLLNSLYKYFIYGEKPMIPTPTRITQNGK